MGEQFGVTPQGFIRKRLDVILEEMHSDISNGFGFNTRNNPQSFLNVLLTNVADKLAELWEVAEESYFAKYPASATDSALDSAMQFGGSVREDDAKTYYPISCTGDDETVLPIGTRLASDTIPAVHLQNLADGRITLTSCNAFSVRLAGEAIDPAQYSIMLNGVSYVPPDGTERNPISILTGICNAIAQDFSNGANAEITEDNLLNVSSNGTDNALCAVLSSTLTTTQVNSTISFATEDYGDIELPKGTITKIVSAPIGLKSISNNTDRIAGRRRETDEEARTSYAEKIFIRSRTMLESITSAILANVQGVTSCRAYQNDTNLWIEHRPPHTVEVIAAGDYDDYAVAKQILGTKAAGIQSCHCCGLDKANPYVGDSIDTTPYSANAVEVEVPGENGEPITIRFSKPIDFNCNVAVEVTLSDEPLAVNAFDLIEETIRTEFAKLKPGADVKPQEWLAGLYKAVSGVAYFDISINAGTHENAKFITDIGYNFLPICAGVTVRGASA
jgi:uncharacterized phage protein gp47/JayE